MTSPEPTPPSIYFSNVNPKYFESQRAYGGTGGTHFIDISETNGTVMSKFETWSDDSFVHWFRATFSDGSVIQKGTEPVDDENIRWTYNSLTIPEGSRVNLLAFAASKWTQPHVGTRRLGKVYIRLDNGNTLSVNADGIPDGWVQYVPTGSGYIGGVFGSSGTDVDCLSFAMLINGPPSKQ